MKANELMVGDFVMMGKKIYRCANICGHTNDVLLDNGVITNIGNLSPIPLTPEILEKNGWIKKDIFMEFKSEYPNIKLDWTSRLGSSLYRNDHYMCDCDYVHELQHALKLLKIDKEIEL